MEVISKDLILREVPLFASFSEEERGIIRQRSELTEYKKGQVIYEEGSPASALYCLIFGRVLTSTKDESGRKTTIEYLHRGKYFGIISLLTKEPHSVSAEVLNDCLILVIKKDDFDFILTEIPRLAIDLSQTLSRRLKRRELHQKTIFESTVLSIFSSSSQVGKSLYALNLALQIQKEVQKSVVILDIAPQDKIHSLPQKLNITETKVFDLSSFTADNPYAIKEFILSSGFGISLVCLHYKPEDEASLKGLLGILSLLVNDFHYIILDLPVFMDRTIFSILNQSDLIHIIASPQALDLKKARNLIDRLQSEFNYRRDKIEVIINEYQLAKITHKEQIQILDQGVFATLPKVEFETADRIVLDNPEDEYAKVIRRISRQLTESLVGLVLGVGVGYGFCHIGVLRVIEREKIPIDVIAGSSIGAFIASLWAIGKTSDEILQITKDFKEPKDIMKLVDLTFPFLGFIKGNKLYRFLKKHFGNKTFYDLRIPLKIIASDVKRKESVVLDKGSLADAIMASCTMPGVFTPFRFKEEMLFDGGIVNPLPTEALLNMGVKKIIAVNVTPSKEDIVRQYSRMKQEMGTLVPEQIRKRKWFNLKQYFKNNFKTNILDIVFSSIEILQSEVAQKEGKLADIVLHPDTSGLYWLDLHKAEEFVKRGEQEALRNLDRIWQMINE